MPYIDPNTGEILNVKGKPLNEHGQELPDPTPMAPPIGFKRQPTMVEYIRDMVRSERLRQEAEAMGHESFEEADDFDVGDDDDFDPKSGWENDFDPPAREIVQEVSESRRRRKPADDSGEAAEAGPKGPSPSPKPATKGESEEA